MLTKCITCGIPAAECVPSPHLGLAPYPEWKCPTCEEEAAIRCSYCNEVLDDTKPLPEPLNDQSFLCPKCDNQLLEELDDFTNNFESYTDGPGGTPWYQHRLSATPSK